MLYKTIYTPMEIHSYIDCAGIIAFDFETAPDAGCRNDPKAALDAHKSHITGISLSVLEGSAVYLPLSHKIGKNAPNPDTVMECLREALFENPNIVKVAHNLSFEAMFLYALGIIVCEPCYDTIAAAQLTLKSKWEFRGLHDSGLKLLATSLFGAEMPDFTTVTGGRHFDEMNPQDTETVRYACADSDYTLRLYHRFNQWFDRFLPGHRYIAEKVESPTSIYVGMMKYNGMLIDRAAMLKKQTEATRRIEAIRNEIAGIIGDVEIGANASTSAFKKYLFINLGLPILKTTAKRQEALDDETMIMLREWCVSNRPELVKLFKLVQEYRKWGKLKSTYIDGYLQHMNNATGRIHPDLMPLGTETGRFACRNPNLQNQVAPGSDPIGVRNFIIANDGYVLIEADYSQVELRIAAYLSRDPSMLNTYRNGEDIHAITTSAIFNISLDEAKDKTHPDYKKRRTVAKSTMFGILYGIYVKGLMRNLKISAGLSYTEEECKQYIDGINRRYAKLSGWQKTVIKRARTCLFAETELGRRRYLPALRSTDLGMRNAAERMAINTPVQGLAADCLKLSMCRLIKILADKPYIRPTMTVHDSLIFEVREDKVEEVSEILRLCMEEAPPLENFIPLSVEISVGKRYGELE